MQQHEMNTCVQLPRTEQIARLNDTLRKTGQGGTIVFTSGLTNVSGFDAAVLMDALANYEAFDADNDPHGERDFGDLTLGRTTQGSVAASKGSGHLVFSNVEVVYWPEGSGTPEGGPHSIHLRNEPDQTLPFEITGQAQRIATIGSFKLNGIEYQMCS